MKNKTFYIIAIILIVASIAFSIVSFPITFSPMATHWNASGQADGYSSKTVGLILMPLMMIVMFILSIIIPKIDPKKENIKSFRDYYNFFIIVILLFFLIMHSFTLSWNSGFEISINKLMAISLGILFYASALVIKHAKQNYFIGIRTPWTLASDVVWKKTHILGYKLFLILSILMLGGLFYESLLYPIMMVSVFSFVFIIVLYSYIEFKKLK